MIRPAALLLLTSMCVVLAAMAAGSCVAGSRAVPSPVPAVRLVAPPIPHRAAPVEAAPPDRPASCVASWYGEAHRGLPTASGALFDPDGLTAASWDVPLGTRLRVAGPAGTVVVTVTDRGPARRLGRCLDLSRAAFARVADLRVGLAGVLVVPA